MRFSSILPALAFSLLALPLRGAVNIHQTLSEFDLGSHDGHAEVLDAGGGLGKVRLQKLAGTLGAWSSAGNLPVPLAYAGSWSQRNRIYIAGGLMPNAMGVTNAVYSADVDAAGNLGAWTWRGQVPAVRQAPCVARVGDRLYFGAGSDTISGRTEVWMAQLGSDGMPGSWTPVTSVPYYSSLFTGARGRLQMQVMYQGVGYGSVLTYEAPILKDGTLGAWAAGPSRNETRTQFGVAEAMDRVFNVGGETSNYLGQSTVDSSALDAQGALSAWTLLTGQPMPSPRAYVFGGRELDYAGKLFVAGGKTGGPDTYYGTAFSTALSASGALGAWSTEASFPGSNRRCWGAVEGAQGKLFYIGGEFAPVGNHRSVSVYAAALNTGAANAAAGVYRHRFDLGSDTQVNQLEATLSAGTPAGSVKARARIASDAGSFGPWTALTVPPLALSQTGRYVEYELRFEDPGSGLEAAVDQVALNITVPTPTSTPAPTMAPGASQHQTLQDFDFGSHDGHAEVLDAGAGLGRVRLQKLAGTLGPWASAGNLPVGLVYTASWSQRNRLFIAGGLLPNPTGASNAIYYADVDSGGNLGPWTLCGTLPAARLALGVARVGDRLYLGGGTDNIVSKTEAWMARLGSDGAPVSWTPVTSVPYGAIRFTAAKGRLQAHVQNHGAGYGSTLTYEAPILKDGTLGSWTAAPSRNEARNGFGLAEAMDRIFNVGGETSNYLGQSTLDSSTVDAQGVLSAWTLLTGQPMPSPRSYLMGGRELDFAGKIFIPGGKTGGPDTYYGTCYATTLNASGGFGAWSTESSFPGSNLRSMAAVEGAQGKLFYIGGEFSPLGNHRSVSVFAAALNTSAANAAAGVYRHRFDLGSDQFISQLEVTLSAGSPAGSVKARARLAADAGAFGAWTALAVPPLNLNQAGRYLEYELRFEDPGSGVDASVDRVGLVLPSSTPTHTPTAVQSPTATQTPTEIPTSSATPTPEATQEGPATAKDEVRAFPNPVKGNNKKMKFAFRLEEDGKVRLKVWNSAAQLAASVEDDLKDGHRLLSLTIADFAPGVYLYQLSVTYASGKTKDFPIQRFAILP